MGDSKQEYAATYIHDGITKEALADFLRQDEEPEDIEDIQQNFSTPPQSPHRNSLVDPDHVPILCIVLSKFHLTLGPIIEAQSPDGYLNKEDFSAIKKYLITKSELCGHLVTINTPRFQICGFPVMISSNKYNRNHFRFNIAFVLGTETDTTPYEPVVRKLAEYLRVLEVESGFMLKADQSQLQVIFDEIYKGLNTCGSSTVQVTDATTIHLSIMDSPPKAPIIHAHEVPVLLYSPASIPLDAFDWTVALILPLVDGVSYARQISHNAGIEIHLTLKALSALVSCGFVQMVPVFQFSNVYMVTEQVRRLLTDKQLRTECARFFHFEEAGNVSEGNQEGGGLNIETLFRCYCDFVARHPMMTVAEFYERRSNHGVLPFDVRRFIQFGCLKGFLRKVDKHALLDPRVDMDDKLAGVLSKIPKTMLSGKHTLDEICCTSKMSSKDLGQELDDDPYTTTFSR
eukprot:m.142848 g.142848  ORF g.142848 m.142848 type:complete len:458 (-) comp14889_c0_seq8:641-2014(-)